MDTVINGNNIKLFSSPYDLFQFAADDFKQRVIHCINQRGECSVVLSGGNTPKAFFTVLSDNTYKHTIPWQHIKFYFSDERYVPIDHVDNNYHMANTFLFSHVPVNPNNIFRIKTEYEHPHDAAIAYEKTLKKASFDFIYLGLGEDAHTASLMPFTDIVNDYSTNDKPYPLVASFFDAKENRYRTTLTPTALNQGGDIIFLVTGKNKAKAVLNVLQGEFNPLHYPAQLIHSQNGKTIWYLDQEAAHQLSIVL